MGREDLDLRNVVDDGLLEGLRLYLKSGASLALEEDASGEIKANLGSVISLIGKPEDMDVLRILIEADIERITEQRAARARGETRSTAMGYSNWFVRAVLALDPVTSDEVLIDLLSKPEYEREAALGLVRLLIPPPTKEGFLQKLDYSVIWKERRDEPSRAAASEKRIRAASALRELIIRLNKERAEASEKRPYDFRLKELAGALAAIDGKGSAELIFKIIEVPSEYESHQRIGILEALLFDGAALPADRVLPVVDSVVVSLRKHGLQQNRLLAVRTGVLSSALR